MTQGKKGAKQTENRMTPEEMRIAIAEACGWRHEDHASFAGWIKEGKPAFSVNDLPDYLSDLNAAFAFADFLASKFDVQIVRHNNSLWKVQFSEPSCEYTAISESLAEAICQSGLRALGMWSHERFS